jgi:hypothetical protein
MAKKMESTKNGAEKHRSGKLLRWLAGIAAAIVSGLVVWWLTQTPQSPLVQERFGISARRADYSSITEQQHETDCFLENSGSAPLTDFSLELRIWEWQEIVSQKIEAYGDPDLCRLVERGKHQHGYYKFLYECSVFNPGETLIFSFVNDNSYYIKRRQTYTPAKVQVLLKAKGFTYKAAIDSDERHPILWAHDR